MPSKATPLKLILTPSQLSKLSTNQEHIPIILYVHTRGEEGGHWLPDAVLTNPLYEGRGRRADPGPQQQEGGTRAQHPEDLYEDWVEEFEERIGHSDDTSTTELTNLGQHKQALGDDYLGAFAQDTLPRLSAGKMAIVNTDRSGESGTHWMGALGLRGGGTLFYDSYGRPIYSEMTEPDAEQGKGENNCGQRSLAWLMVYKMLGESGARAI